MVKRMIALGLALILMLGSVVGVSADTAAAYQDAVAWCKENIAAAWGSEWAVIGLSIGGKLGDGWKSRYVASVEKTMEDKGGELSTRTYTEYSRTILGLTAAGANVEDVAGYNLLEKLADFDKVSFQGLGGPVWALIALDSGNYEVPATLSGTQNSREKLIEYILDKELEGGGWAIMGTVADTDMTAGALIALAAYRDRADVKAVVDRGIEKLSSLQHEDGTYDSFSDPNPESCVQVLVALLTLGLDAADERFVKNGITLEDAILSFMLEDGSFEHAKGQGSNILASAQSMMGLTALYKDRNPYDLNHKKYVEPVEEVTTAAVTEEKTTEQKTAEEKPEITTAIVQEPAGTERETTTAAPAEGEETTAAPGTEVATEEADTADRTTAAPDAPVDTDKAPTGEVSTFEDAGTAEENNDKTDMTLVFVCLGVAILVAVSLIWRKKKHE